MVIKLPTFNEYTVDFRLKEFRKAVYGKSLEFIPFASRKGKKLLEDYYESVTAERRQLTGK
mgnify:CR=1 FL=1